MYIIWGRACKMGNGNRKGVQIDWERTSNDGIRILFIFSCKMYLTKKKVTELENPKMH